MKILRIIKDILVAVLPIFRKGKLDEDSVIVILEIIVAILIIVISKF